MNDGDAREPRELIRNDSHLALGCGFAFALLVVSILIALLLIGA